MITDEQAADAVELMRLCRFFPSSELQRAQVAGLLVDMVETKGQLDWLVTAQCKLDWQGPAELRALFSTRFQPCDAMAAVDPERAYFECEAAATDRRISEWKREQKLLGEPPAVIDAAPAIKRVDRTADDLQFERVQQHLGKEVKPIHIPATPTRTPEERAALLHEMETALGIEDIPRRFGYCSAFEQIPGSDFRFRPNLPVCSGEPA